MTIPDSIAWAKPEDVGMSRERLARLGDVIAADVAGGRIPGAVTLVARGGRIVHFKAHGALTPAPDSPPMERDSLFRIYSMTKPVVSVAAMMLVEEGRLTLSDPVSAFIPEFADATVQEGDRRVPLAWPIVVHDLLRHTAGLTYGWGDSAVERLYREARIGRRSVPLAEQARALAAIPLVRQPGTGWIYSVATDVLGRVIEVVSGETLGDHLRRRVFEPLGMGDTAFSVRPGQEGRLAEAFATDPDTGGPVQLLNVSVRPAFESGGGGLVSSAPDYARFLHMLAAGGSLEGTRLLSPATLAFMTADHLAAGMEGGDGMLPAGYGFGLGFAVRRAAGLAPFPGSAGDFYWEGLGGTGFWVDPAEEVYALSMIQAPGRLAHYRHVVRQLVYGAIVERAAG